ncbi:MAG: DUF1080 domain-containing protein [Phycisphaeraceae bacterium]
MHLSLSRMPVIVMFVCLFTAGLPLAALAERPLNQPPKGFQALFNGENLEGWHGMPHFDPRELWAMDENERQEQLAEWTRVARNHWTVEDGVLINDGHGPYMTTAKEYGDFELLLEYRTKAGADSGIYLRGNPQVQIWDWTQEAGWGNGSHLGSGGLWNNSPGAPGKDPLLRADRPFGEWNAVRIVMVGSRVTVWLNGQMVVDHAVMENFWDRSQPLWKDGPIQLQTHGGEIRWRNLFIREIDHAEANTILRNGGPARNVPDPKFKPIFNGQDFSGWTGPVDNDNNTVEDGAILSGHGTIHTEKEYGNFIARLEYKLEPGDNNGLAIRYPGEGDTAYVGMTELQVLDDDAESYAELDPRQYNGSVYGQIAAHRGFLRPTGEWNYSEITVNGSRITVELNGYVIVDGDLEAVEDYMGGDADRYAGRTRTQGYFGLAGHGNPVAYRKLAIKELP